MLLYVPTICFFFGATIIAFSVYSKQLCINVFPIFAAAIGLSATLAGLSMRTSMLLAARKDDKADLFHISGLNLFYATMLFVIATVLVYPLKSPLFDFYWRIFGEYLGFMVLYGSSASMFLLGVACSTKVLFKLNKYFLKAFVIDKKSVFDIFSS